MNIRYLSATMITPSRLVSWLFLIILSIYSSLLFSHIVVLSGQCLSHQRSLLLQLKHTLIFNATDSLILEQWNQSSDCCTWSGISCDQEGHVIGLKLSKEPIFGGIDNHSVLFDLVYLKSLDLSFIGLDSTIPSSVGKLTDLSYLNFSYTGFMGQIPKEISRLTKLVILDFSSSESMLDLGSPSLMMLVQNLTKLEEVYLEGANILSLGNEWGSSLPNLRVLSMGYCLPFDDQIFHKSSPFPTSSSVNFPNLTSFSIHDCSLNGTFPKQIFQVPTLRTLDMSGNELLDGSLPEFPPYSNLQSLVLHSTNFRGSLPASIGNLGQLSSLDLGNCHFSGPLPKSMTKLTQLVYLDLSSNSFTGPLPSFHLFKNLTDLLLSHNGFTGPIPLVHWESFLNLVNVDLKNNSLNGNIPSSMFSLPSVQTIDLSSNQFSGQLVEFPTFEPASSMLRTVDLSWNHLQGPIPMSIFKLPGLQHLSLSYNNFIGTIQLLDIFQNLPILSSLDLSYNNFSVNASSGNSNFSSLHEYLLDLRLASCRLGMFPDIIKNQQETFSYLDLSNNHIHGKIPNWIWKVMEIDGVLNLSRNHLVGMQEPYSFSYIHTLDLSFNKLRGKIPVPILSAYPTYIDLSTNNFTSSIPSDIGDVLYGALYFSVSNNGLTGDIPESICRASDIELIDLSNNSLHGRIPTCMVALSRTLGLNLRNNNLSGPIPDAFPVTCFLQTLDLNGNLLTGRIPKSLANCKALEVLNLGNNKMLGTFPMLLKDIPTLRVLVLRSNRFYGHITCGDKIGNWLKIQILNVASNNFSGELPSKCLTKWHAMMGMEDDVQSPLLNKTAEFNEATPSWINYNYEDGVTVTNKRLEMELLKIPRGFTDIDFSSNNFHGDIPKELGHLNYLIVLNLSDNALNGQIPSSFGNMQQLESLDLSRNRLKGKIPASLSNLNFLSVLDLSYNQLVGRIPKGTQIQTFSADCFQGNEGLCGPPLTLHCIGDAANMLPETPHEARHSNSGSRIEWDLIGAEVGFLVGFGGVIGPLVFSRRWRKYYFDRAEDIAFSILPQLVLKKWLSWKMGVRK